MTDPNAFIKHVDQVLAENDASNLPPLDEPQLIKRGQIIRITDAGPEPVIQIAQPMPRTWWRRILGRPR